MTDRTNSYLGRRFKVIDPDARLRDQDNLMAYIHDQDASGNSVFAIIPKDTIVHVDQVRLVNRGLDGPLLFVHALDPNGNAFGWTSSRNLAGRFVNQTLGAMPPPNSDKKGPNAAWVGGSFKRQLTLVPIVGARLQILYVAEDTLEAYMSLVEAAAADRKLVAINSAFRSWREQKQLYDGYVKKLPGYNLAAEPGKSNHQNGIAFDIDVPGGAGNAVYDWLAVNATRYGFLRTVNKEPWHWEYDTARAQVAMDAGTFKLDRVLI